MTTAERSLAWLKEHGWQVDMRKDTQWTVTATQAGRTMTHSAFLLRDAVSEVHRQAKYGGD